MLTVWLVDKNTRLILPGSQWGFDVRERLTQLGHSVQATDQDPDIDDRSEAERVRRDALLAKTGL